MSTATDLLAAYISAELKILDGQSARFGDRILTRANLAEVQSMREKLERRVQAETNSDGLRHQLADFS